MKRLYLDQIAYRMSRAEKTNYDDIDKASAALKWSVEKIESYLNKCLNVENGQCSTTWRHDECKTLMDILYDLTEDEKYKEKEWIFDPKKKSLWD
jgi:hypothetical protein